MKKILFLLIAAGLTLAATAQKNFLNRNDDGHIIKTRVTTDSDYHYIDSFVIANYEAGIYELTIIGASATNFYSIRGVLKGTYVMRNGTLTVTTSVNDVTPQVESQISATASFDVTTSSNKAYIRVRGKVNTTIYWYSVLKRKSVY